MSACEKEYRQKGGDHERVIVNEGKRVANNRISGAVHEFTDGCGVHSVRQECSLDGALEPPCRVRNRQNGRQATRWYCGTPSLMH